MATGNANADNRPPGLGHTDDKEWPEVRLINNYAVFMGYVSMAVTGIGFVAFTWSTVVLLGGFVTLLEKEDFWSLTVITLFQTRVFDVFLEGTTIISNFEYSFRGLWEAALSVVALPRKDEYSKRWVVRLLVFTILLCPLFGLYMFGLFVSPWISLWRLWRTIGGHGHMWGEKANLEPALVVLYSLALLQGVLFYYWAISTLEEERLVKKVAEKYGLGEKDEARNAVSDYLRKIMAECEKNPSYARGRNLITYAVDLMESNCPANYRPGARILDMLIRLQPKERPISNMGASDSSADAGSSVNSNLSQPVVDSQGILINNLIGLASSSDAINRLVRMLDSKGQRHGKINTRHCAMRIVAHFAREIHLHKIMHGIDSICSLLQLQGSDSEKNYQEYSTGMEILLKLAKHEDNFRVMRNREDITKKIVAVIVECDKLHGENHEDWLSIARPGMNLIQQFVSATASSMSRDARHLDEIQQGQNGIVTLQTMLYCQKCEEDKELWPSVILAITQVVLSMPDDSSGQQKDANNNLRESFIKLLVKMFLKDSSDENNKKLAGESLAQLSNRSKTSAMLILSAEGGIVDRLIHVLENYNNNFRKSAADILKHLFRHCKSDDKNFENLKEAMIQCIPGVLKEVLLGNPYWWCSCFKEVQEALVSLCATVHKTLVRAHPDLNEKFKQKAIWICKEIDKDPATEFTELLTEAEQVVDEYRKTLSSPGLLPPRRFISYEEPPACCIS